MFMATLKNRNIIHLSLILIVLSFAFLPKADAKIFRNSYVSFELPPKWDCYLENTAWVCRYAIAKTCKGAKSGSKGCKDQKQKTKEAIIILTAKEVGPKDSFQIYHKHLKTPRPIVTRKGVRAKSKIIHVKHVSIANHRWIDGMHLGSEIPHYYTRYLATIKGNIAVLVTFSAHKLFYTKYSHHFFRAIKSMRVVATKASTIKPRELKKQKPGTLGVNIEGHLGEAIDAEGDSDFDAADNEDSSTGLLFFAAFVLAAIGIYIWMKGRR